MLWAFWFSDVVDFSGVKGSVISCFCFFFCWVLQGFMAKSYYRSGQSPRATL